MGERWRATIIKTNCLSWKENEKMQETNKKLGRKTPASQNNLKDKRIFIYFTIRQHASSVSFIIFPVVFVA